jgi:hypothetical protein
MFKYLLDILTRPSQKTLRAGLQRYVDIEFRPGDRSAELERLLKKVQS